MIHFWWEEKPTERVEALGLNFIFWGWHNARWYPANSYTGKRAHWEHHSYQWISFVMCWRDIEKPREPTGPPTCPGSVNI